MVHDRPFSALALALFAGLAGACATRHAAVPLSADQLAQLTSEVDGQRSEVRLAPAAAHPVAASAGRKDAPASEIIRGETRLGIDGLQIATRNGALVVPLTSIQEIKVRNRDTGLEHGLAIGGLGGAVLGATLGFAAGGCGEQSQQGFDICMGRKATAVLFAVPLAVLGAVIGGVMGAAAGDGPSWRFGPYLPASASR